MESLKKTKGGCTTIGLLAVLLLLNSSPQSDAQSGHCTGVDCGKGQCVEDSTQITGYKCICDQGWSQITGLDFLSCFLPNCTLNFGCDGTPAPAPTTATVSTSDIFDSPFNFSWCSLVPGICGSGDCVTIPATQFLELPSYECDCRPGSSNLLNQTNAPCLPNCAVSGSCLALNITLTPSPPSNGAFAPAPNEGEKQWSLFRGLTIAIFATSVMWLCF